MGIYRAVLKFVLIVAVVVVYTPLLVRAGGETSELREQIIVLDQARSKAAGELAALQKLGTVTKRDIAHYTTVDHFLAQEIKSACTRLASLGDTVPVAGCPQAFRQKRQKKSPPVVVKPSPTVPVSTSPDESEKESVEQAAITKPVTAEQKNTRSVSARSRQPNPKPPSQGFFATLRQWFALLFQPKPPVPPTHSSQVPVQTTEENSVLQEEQVDAAGHPGQQKRSTTGRQKVDTLNKKDKQAALTGNLQQRDRQEKAEVVAQPATPLVKSEIPDTAQIGSHQADQQHGLSVSKSLDSQSGPHKRRTARQNNASGVTGASPSHGVTRQEKKVLDKGGATVNNSTGKNKHQHGLVKGVPASPAPAVAKAKEPATGKDTGPTGLVGHRQTEQSRTGSAPATSAEIRELDASLNQALGRFDGALLTEQERLANRLPRQREEGRYGATGLAGAVVQGAGMAGGTAGTDHGTAPVGPAGSSSSGLGPAGNSAAPGSGRTTIGTDDDIVARQLREAAAKETDPVLQKKLWKEYRKYKEGS